MDEHMEELCFRCLGCRDRRSVGTVRRYCLCGAVSARAIGDVVMLAGPGEIVVGMTGSGPDRFSAVRPSPVGT